MKFSLKVILCISFIAVLSSLAAIEKPSTAEAAGKMPLYSITAFTKPECYSGGCYVKESGGAIVYPISSSGNYYFQNNLFPGTWQVYVCCDGWFGTAGPIVLTNGTLAQITVELQQGECPYGD
jgi:hypothetical protein